MTTQNSDSSIHSEHVQIGEYQLMFHHWPCHSPDATPAVALIFHGFLAHGLYPTVRYAADVLQQHNLRVLSYDMQGHGRSEGLSGYLPSAEQVLHEATAVAKYVQATYCANPQQKLFLVGSSMGGAIALGVSSRITTTASGVVLLAPMLQLSVSSLEQTLLQGLAVLVPTLSCIPSSSTSAALQYRDPMKRQECEQDPLVVQGRTIRVGSANTCVQLTRIVQQTPTTVPLLILLADEDVIVQNQGAERFYEQCADNNDKTLKRYPALHGLLCEPSPLLDQIQQDLVEWIQARL